MKKILIVLSCFVSSLSFAPVSFAKSNPSRAQAKTSSKLSSKQTVKCIYSDKSTESAFQDLQAAYGLRLIEAKVFFKSMDSARSCPELKKNLQNLRKEMIAAMPRSPMRSPSPGSQASTGSTTPSTASNIPNASGFTGGTNPYEAGEIEDFGASPYGVPPVQPYPGADFYAPPTDSYGFPLDEIDY